MLLVAGGLGMAGVRSLADEALAAGCNVIVLFGAANGTRGLSVSSLLPDEVEYVVSTDDGSFGHHGFVTELVPQFEAWADQCFACGPQPMLAAMARLAAGRQARLGVARLGARRGRGSKSAPLGSQTGTPPRVAAGVDGAEHGLCRRRLPGLRRDVRRRSATRLPRGPGLRHRRDRLGGLAVTSTTAAATDVDLSVDLGRGLILRNPVMVASGTFGYGTEYSEVVDIQRLGAICSKGTTLRPGSATRRRA